MGLRGHLRSSYAIDIPVDQSSNLFISYRLHNRQYRVCCFASCPSAMSATSSEAAPDSRLGEEPAVVDAVELQWSGSQDASSLTGSSDATTTSKKTPLQQAQEQAAWHEDRIRRRLQNEYERAGKALSDIVSRYCIAGRMELLT